MSLGCPRCVNALVGRRIHDVVVHECPECDGVFLDENAIGLIVEDPSPGRQRAHSILAELPHRPRNVRPGKAKKYLACPLCKKAMNRRQFDVGAGVVVDVCRAHGTFFDVGEIATVVDFVMKGGLEKAAKKTLERMPMQGLAKYLASAALASRVREDDSFDEGDAFVGLLFELLA